MTTIEVGGQTYRIGKIDAMTQLHITRRLAPVMAKMGIGLDDLQGKAKITINDFMPLLEPISRVIAMMSNVDVEYIIHTSLTVVHRQQEGGKWAPTTTGSRIMFEDIDMTVMLRLTVEALKLNLSPFFEGLGAALLSPSP